MTSENLYMCSFLLPSPATEIYPNANYFLAAESACAHMPHCSAGTFETPPSAPGKHKALRVRWHTPRSPATCACRVPEEVTFKAVILKDFKFK